MMGIRILSVRAECDFCDRYVKAKTSIKLLAQRLKDSGWKICGDEENYTTYYLVCPQCREKYSEPNPPAPATDEEE